MDALRTPDDRFDGLPDYAFTPHYAEVGDGLRMHYLDEAPGAGAPSSGTTIVLLHGEPSWSFLYRRMIPVLTAAGHRCIAPDLVGFGRSDKPAAFEDYSVAGHLEWVRELLFDRLALDGITLFGQDWGGILGLRLVGEHPDRFARVAIGNSGLPTGDEHVPEALTMWQEFARTARTLPVGGVITSGCTTELTAEVVAAYDAPFPDESYKSGARAFPSLIPTTPDNVASAAHRAAWEVLARFDRPFLCCFSDGDPITAGADRKMLDTIPGTAGQPHTTIAGAGHFLQEDSGEELATVLVDWLA
jgi:haloalkane dehalogenase